MGPITISRAPHNSIYDSQGASHLDRAARPPGLTTHTDRLALQVLSPAGKGRECLVEQKSDATKNHMKV